MWRTKRRGTLLLMVVGLLATLFLIISAFITLARFDNLTLQNTQQAAKVNEVLRSADNMVLSTIRQAWADGNGNLLAGGRQNPNPGVTPSYTVLPTYSYENVPGTRGTAWLSGAEVMRDHDPRAPVFVPEGSLQDFQVHRQTVSSFDGAPAPRQFPLVGASGWTGYEQRGLMLQDPNSPDPLRFTDADILWNTRRPSMDADGDGVADSSFVGMGPLIEMGNALVGKPVRSPAAFGTFEFNPSEVAKTGGESAILGMMFQDFNNKARYELAAKVESHGGKIALASPGNYAGAGTVWNREFVTGMFNWVKHQNDTTRLLPTDNSTFNSLVSTGSVIEPYLRYRGGLLSTRAEVLGTGIPNLLANLENTFTETFRPVYGTFGYQRGAEWQRFKLSNPGSEFGLWRKASAVDADWYNMVYTPTSTFPQVEYSRRQLLTTVSNSDDLARKLDPTIPVATDPTGLGLYPGQLKFFLGDIARAFNADGTFKGTVADPAGFAIIHRLANYYYEMLNEYKGWSGETTSDQAVTKRDQAFMLAVNTVAFAAPRNAGGLPGGIDSVWYTDNAVSPKTYIGYTPQPCITQVVAYNEYEETGGTNKKALAVELYFPHDPGPNVNPALPDVTWRFDNANDPFAINLGQYAISINQGGTDLRVLGTALNPVHVRLSGRSFLTLSIHGLGGSTKFDTAQFVGNTPPVPMDGHITDLAIGPTVTSFQSSEEPPRTFQGIVVKLWRMGSTTSGFSTVSGGWYVIDEFRLLFGDASGNPSSPSDDSEWIAYGSRDTGADLHLGGDWNGEGIVETPARWRTVSSIGAEPGRWESGFATTWDVRRVAMGPTGHTTDATAAPKGPSIPLCTMNAGSTFGAAVPGSGLPSGFFNGNPIHGAIRPRSFPTVGFMLFVPRFAHMYDAVAAAPWKPMSRTLADQWAKGTSLSASGPVNYPADFGHMPIFDNTQQLAHLQSYFDKTNAGQIPWGLLVFDYFTTIDPKADRDADGRPDVDPRRIPSRIDINTAPWYVLAGLPVIDPTTLANEPDNFLPDPAFWSTRSGILTGTFRGNSTDLTVTYPDGQMWRYPAPAWSRSPLLVDTTNGWQRLGPHLAQAIVAYRDRIRYTSSPAVGGLNPYWTADRRNDATLDLGGTEPEQDFTRYRREVTETSSPTFSCFRYGKMRRDDGTARGPSFGSANYKFGFLSLGELVNVKGFESPIYNVAAPGSASNMLYNPLGPAVSGSYFTRLNVPDFFRAVSLIALLDTHFLTTRSNTFTVYMTLNERDPERQQSSVRVQYTIDRSNLLPQLVVDANGVPVLQDLTGLAGVPDGIPETPIIIQNQGLPEILTRTEVGYFDTQFE